MKETFKYFHKPIKINLLNHEILKSLCQGRKESEILGFYLLCNFLAQWPQVNQLLTRGDRHHSPEILQLLPNCSTSTFARPPVHSPPHSQCLFLNVNQITSLVCFQLSNKLPITFQHGFKGSVLSVPCTSALTTFPTIFLPAYYSRTHWLPFFVLQGHLPLFCLLAFAWLQIVLYRWSSFRLSSNVTSSDFTTTPHAQLHYPVPLSSLYLKFPYLCICSLVIISWLPQQKVHSVTEVILCDCDAAQGGWTQ